MKVDFWEEQQWMNEIEEHEVLIYNIDLLWFYFKIINVL